MFKYLFILILSINAFSFKITHIDDFGNKKDVIYKIVYWNLDGATFKTLKDRKKLITKYLNKKNNMMLLFNNVLQPGAINTTKLVFEWRYTSRSNNQTMERFVYGLNPMFKSYYKPHKGGFPDEGSLFKPERINIMFLDGFMYIMVDFKDKYTTRPNKKLIQKIKNLNEVVKWGRTQGYLRENIVILGRFGVPHYILKKYISGFTPLIKKGTEISFEKIKRSKKYKTRMYNSENILTHNKKIKANIDYRILQGLNALEYTKKFGHYLPINIYIKNHRPDRKF